MKCFSDLSNPYYIIVYFVLLFIYVFRSMLLLVTLPVACCLLPVACCLLPVACCLLPVACCLVPGAWCLVPGAWCLVPGAWCLVPGAWCYLRIMYYVSFAFAFAFV
jgi:hypothetical protein